MRLSASGDVSLDGIPRSCRGQRRGSAPRPGLAGRLGLALRVADYEEKTGRWHIRVSTRVRWHKVVRLSELVSHWVDSTTDSGRKQKKAAQGALARDINSYVVLPNRQCSTRPRGPSPKHFGSVRVSTRARSCRRKASLVVY